MTHFTHTSHITHTYLYILKNAVHDSEDDDGEGGDDDDDEDEDDAADDGGFAAMLNRSNAKLKGKLARNTHGT